MKKNIWVFLLVMMSSWAIAQEIRGVVLVEEDIKVEQALVMNMRTNERVYTDQEGKFQISAKNEDELRIVKKGYDRLIYKVKNSDFQGEVVLRVAFSELMIEELVISKIKLTGDLAVDTKTLDKEDRNEKLQKALGIAEIEKKVKSLGGGSLSFDPNNFGKNRKRKKNLESYERQENNAEWIVIRVEEEFFISKGIPRERIMEFVNFALTEKTELSALIKSRNLTKIRSVLESVFPAYLKRLKSVG